MDLREVPIEDILGAGINVSYLVDAYHAVTDASPGSSFWGSPDGNGLYWIDKLSGSSDLRLMIEEGATAEEIKESWQEDVSSFLERRKPYQVCVEAPQTLRSHRRIRLREILLACLRAKRFDMVKRVMHGDRVLLSGGGCGGDFRSRPHGWESSWITGGRFWRKFSLLPPRMGDFLDYGGRFRRGIFVVAPTDGKILRFRGGWL